MALDAIVRRVLVTANRVTGSLQVPVIHQAWVGDLAYAKPSYATGVSRQAIVEQGGKPWRTPAGDEITPRAMIYFLAPIPDNGAANRTEPVDPRDLFTLPDGKVGRVALKDPALLDPATSRGYYHTAALL